jgi:hypothetical protein
MAKRRAAMKRNDKLGEVLRYAQKTVRKMERELDRDGVDPLGDNQRTALVFVVANSYLDGGRNALAGTFTDPKKP